MPPILITATLASTSGLPEDETVLSFAVQCNLNATPEPGNTLHLVDPIQDFLAENSNYLSGRISRAADDVTYRFYDLTGAQGMYIDPVDGKKKVQPHGSPVATDSGQVIGAPASTTNLPSEVAVCVTLRANGWANLPVENSAGERPKSRASGRMYIGPLNSAALDVAGDRPSLDILSDLRSACATLRDNFDSGGALWCVWSRANGAFLPITHVQTDNAFDTQRRRGLAPTSRVTVEVGTPSEIALAGP